MIPAPHALLLDFDGLLADYDHRRHLQHLADAAGCMPAQVDAALRGEGLELAHARGDLDGDALLHELNTRLGSQLHARHWFAARTAASKLRRDALAVLGKVRSGVHIAVLTNNGPLSVAAITTSDARGTPAMPLEVSIRISSMVICVLSGRWMS